MSMERASLGETIITSVSSSSVHQVAFQTIETLSQWKVGNIYHFDNLGFCRTENPSSTSKFLTCADCEREIIGIHYLAHHPEYPNICFLSHDRVAYLDFDSKKN